MLTTWASDPELCPLACLHSKTSQMCDRYGEQSTPSKKEQFLIQIQLVSIVNRYLPIILVTPNTHTLHMSLSQSWKSTRATALICQLVSLLFGSSNWSPWTPRLINNIFYLWYFKPTENANSIYIGFCTRCWQFVVVGRRVAVEAIHVFIPWKENNVWYLLTKQYFILSSG